MMTFDSLILQQNMNLVAAIPPNRPVSTDFKGFHLLSHLPFSCNIGSPILGYACLNLPCLVSTSSNNTSASSIFQVLKTVRSSLICSGTVTDSSLEQEFLHASSFSILLKVRLNLKVTQGPYLEVRHLIYQYP